LFRRSYIHYCGDESFLKNDYNFINEEENDLLRHYLYFCLPNGDNDIDPNNIFDSNKNNLLFYGLEDCNDEKKIKENELP